MYQWSFNIFIIFLLIKFLLRASKKVRITQKIEYLVNTPGRRGNYETKICKTNVPNDHTPAVEYLWAV